MKTNLMRARVWRLCVAALLLFVVSVAANAYDFEAKNDDGVTIYYNILSSSNGTCEVTYRTSSYNSYSGNVVIPETVTYSETTYSVTGIGGNAFNSCSGLTSVTIPESVTTIGSYAFYGCTSLTEITIPESVTTIGNYAFESCTSLTEITIPNSVTSIGQRAFSGCTGLTEVVIGNGVTSISSQAFYECTGLTEITIPNSVTSIGDKAFQYCSGLTEVNFNAIACTSTGSSSSRAFSGCDNISTFNFGDKVTIIPAYLCSGLKELTEISIPNSVTEIGSSAFYSCTGLKDELTIPESVTTIGNEAFSRCTGLNTVNFNAIACASAGSSSNTTFNGCSRLSTVNVGENVTIIPDYLFYERTNLRIVNFNAIACTSVGSSTNCLAFYGCTNISTFNFGDNVTIIPDYLCYEMTALTQVTIPESVTEIGGRVFSNCMGLTEVNFNATACESAGIRSTSTGTSISPIFRGCSNLTTINFGDNVTMIPECLCYNFAGLTSITFPSSVTSIGYAAFYGCTGLTQVSIPERVTHIGNQAFHECTGLAGTLTIPESITYLGSNAFERCTGLKEVNFNATACTFASRAFSSCSNLTTINFGDKVTIIPEGICRGTTGLTSITIPNSVTSIGDEAFEGCTWLTEIAIPNSVTSIGTVTFWNCTELTEVTIPNSVTEIGESAFCDCTNLTQVTIGYNVTFIGDWAFCRTNLKEIYSKNPTPPDICENTFDKVDKNTCILYVPISSKNVYNIADYWSEFFNMEEMIFDDLPTPPMVQTYEATEVTTSSALLRGVVTIGDEEVLEQGFEYWADGGKLQTITSPDLIMAVTLTGLLDGVTYTYRAYAITESGTTYGEVMTFTTIKAPTVQTYEVTEITENSALLKGYVTAGNEDLLGQGFEYWAAGGEVQTIAMADQMMAVTITGLSEGITYTCRAYAKTASGTTYGNEVTFTTFTPPTVQTYEATEVTVSSATLSGVVVAGSEKVTEQGFEYWSSSSDVQTVASTSSSMSVTVANLKSSTKYTYRAYAKTESGTTYGNDVSFTTLNIGVYKELDEAVEELNEDFNVAWTTVITDYPDAEEDCMDYYDAIFNKVKELTDLLDSSYRKGTLYDDVVDEIWSGIAEGERMIEEMLEAAKELHATGIEGIIVNCGDDVQVYNLAGSRVHRIERGNVYIIRNADGTAKKVLVK